MTEDCEKSACTLIEALEQRVGGVEKQLCTITKTLLGDRGNPESMRRSVFGMVERWSNWMDTFVFVMKALAGCAVAGSACVAIAKGAGLL